MPIKIKFCSSLFVIVSMWQICPTLPLKFLFDKLFKMFFFTSELEEIL